MGVDDRWLSVTGDGARLVSVEQFFQSLARAVYQFRVYSDGSPFRTEAVMLAQRHLAGIASGGGRLDVGVTDRELIVEEGALGAGSIVERELARRMHLASIARFSIRYDCSQQDLAQFCAALVAVQTGGDTSVSDLLAERGVERIQVEAAHRPEVIEFAEATETVSALVRRERQRRDGLFTTGASVYHLYPPDRGWIRLDPSSPVSTVSLPELAILVSDPTRLATILLRLSGEDVGPGDEAAALERKFSDVATVFATLQPHVSRVMFARLAEAVLSLDATRRTRLLKRTVLPSLLDGRIDGSILQDFPVVDLADALCLLLELETAAPEMLSVAFSKLDLPPERREAVLPVLNERIRQRGLAHAEGAEPNKLLDGYAERLIHIDGGRTKDLAELAAFDVSLDQATLATVAAIRETAGTTDLVDQQLRCLCSLVRLEANPDRVEDFLSLIARLLAALEGQGQQGAVASWLGTLRANATSVGERRPQVTDCVSALIETFCTGERAARLVELYQGDTDARALANAYVEALSPAIAPFFADLFEDRQARVALPALVDLVCAHAPALAPGFLQELDHRSPEAVRRIVRALGYAGQGYEVPVAEYLMNGDPTISREALHALVRIGTDHAVTLVAAHIVGADDTLRKAAVEALWRFPQAVARAPLLSILRQDDFVVRHPDLVLQLLTRAQTGSVDGFEPELRHLATLHRRFWRPALVRVASKARQLLAS